MKEWLVLEQRPQARNTGSNNFARKAKEFLIAQKNSLLIIKRYLPHRMLIQSANLKIYGILFDPMNGRVIPLLSFLCLLTHCSSTPPGSSLGPSTLPILSSPARANAWGPPERTKAKDGYSLLYINPANSKEKLTITGSSELMFFLLYPPHLTRHSHC